MNKEVIDYILKSREVGQSNEQIKENLLIAGWINENIDRGFNSYLIQNLILKSKGEGLKDKQIIENLINSKYDKNDIYDAYDYLVKKFGRKIMPRYYILWMPFFHRLRYRADIHSYIFKRWGFLNPFSGKLISTKKPTGKLMVGIFLILLLISVIRPIYRSLSIPSTVSSIKTELSRMSGSNTPSQSAQTAITSPISITESTILTEAESQKIKVGITPILLKDLDTEALKSSGWSWYGNFPTKGAILDWADKDSFMIYPGTSYFKDKNRVYFDISQLVEADSNSFVVYDEYFAKDKNKIYLLGMAEYPQTLDVDTFEKVGLNYFKDKNSIYFSDLIFEKKFGQSSYYHLEPINGFDPDSFKYLGICGCVEKSCSFYVKDKNNAFCGYDNNFSIINGVDSTSFEYVGLYDENPEGMPVSSGIAKDKNCIYRSGKKVLDANGVCINPINCTEDKLASGCGFK